MDDPELQFISDGNLEEIKNILSCEKISTLFIHFSFSEACKEEDIEILKLLLNDSRISKICINTPLETAINNENEELLKILLEYFDPNEIHVMVFVNIKNPKILQILLNDQRLKIEDYFKLALIYSKLEIIELLLQDQKIVDYLQIHPEIITKGRNRHIRQACFNALYKPDNTKYQEFIKYII